MFFVCLFTFQASVLEEQSIIVNDYVKLSRLGVLLPTLIPPFGQEFLTCSAGEGHGLLTSIEKEEVGYFQRSGQPLNVQIVFY